VKLIHSQLQALSPCVTLWTVCHHRAIKLTQNFVWFTNPWINLLSLFRLTSLIASLTAQQFLRFQRLPRKRFVIGVAWHCIYCKFSHAAITAPDKRNHVLRYHFSFNDRADDILDPSIYYHQRCSNHSICSLELWQVDMNFHSN